MKYFQYLILLLLFNPFNMIYLNHLRTTSLYAQTLDEGGMPPPPPPPPKFPPSSPTQPFKSGKTSQINKINPNKKSFADAYTEDITNENFPDLVESFDFQNADISDVVKSISKLTGKNFIIDVQNLRGKITIIAPSRITVAEAYKAFLSALAINNLTVIPTSDGKFLKIVQLRIAQKNSEIFTGSYTPNTDQMITRLIQLKHTKASDANTLLRSLISTQAILQHHEPTDTIVITDFGSNINKIMRVIEKIDASSVNEQMVVIPIRFARAKNIAELIEKILNKGETPSKGGGRPNIPRFRRQGQQGQQSTSAFSLVLPDERTNSIIVLANRQGIVEIRRLVKQLDFAIEDEGGLYVYYVKHGKAEDIANTINGIAEDKKGGASNKGANIPGRPPFRPGLTPPKTSSSSGGAGLLGGEIKVTHSEQTNSLIIAAGRQDYEVILNLLSKIDIPRDQVFVEAIILEMAVNDQLNYGFNILGVLPNTNGLGRAGFVSPGGLQQFVNVLGTTGLVLGFATGSPVMINPNPLAGNSASNFEVRSVNGFVNFLKTVTEVNVLSTPQILALDNAEAEIEVGERVPVGNSIETNTAGITQARPDYEDANIKLKIIPQISSDQETVRLEIDQSIKDVVPNAKSPSSPSFTTRALKSDVIVRNGDTIVIGGLMRDIESPTTSKIPILGDIPILGWLFKSKRVSINKINLLVFLTPRIIKTRADVRRLSDFKLKERLQFIKDVGGRDAHGRKIEEIRISNARGHVATEDLLENSIEDLQSPEIEELPSTVEETTEEDLIEDDLLDEDIEEALQSSEIEELPSIEEDLIEDTVPDEDTTEDLQSSEIDELPSTEETLTEDNIPDEDTEGALQFSEIDDITLGEEENNTNLVEENIDQNTNEVLELQEEPEETEDFATLQEEDDTKSEEEENNEGESEFKFEF